MGIGAPPTMKPAARRRRATFSSSRRSRIHVRAAVARAAITSYYSRDPAAGRCYQASSHHPVAAKRWVSLCGCSILGGKQREESGQDGALGNGETGSRCPSSRTPAGTRAGIDHGRHIGAACHSRNGEEGRLRSLMTRPSLTNRSAVRLGQHCGIMHTDDRMRSIWAAELELAMNGKGVYC